MSDRAHYLALWKQYRDQAEVHNGIVKVGSAVVVAVDELLKLLRAEHDAVGDYLDWVGFDDAEAGRSLAELRIARAQVGIEP